MTTTGPIYLTNQPTQDASTNLVPIKFNGNLYLPGYFEQVSPPGTNYVGIFKSIDNGVTWTFLQGIATGYNWTQDDAAAYDPSTNTWWIGYGDGTIGNLSILSFDVATETFGAPIIGPVFISFTNIVMAVKNGDLYFYFVTAPNRDTLSTQTYISGVWGTVTSVDGPNTGAQVYALQAFIDNTGIPCCLYNVTGISGNGLAMRWTGQGGVTTLFGDADAVTHETFNVTTTGAYDSTNNRFLFCFGFINPSFITPITPTTNVNILIVPQASPSTASWVALGPNTDILFNSCLTIDGTTVYAMVATFSLSSPTTTGELLFWTSSLGSLGTATGPTTFWDQLTNPFSDGHNFALPAIIASAVYSSSLLGLIGGFEPGDNSHAYWISQPLAMTDIMLNISLVVKDENFKNVTLNIGLKTKDMVNPSSVNPFPVTNPTECINQ